MYIWRNSVYTYQRNDNDCGFTCLRILLANLNHDRNYLFMPNHFSQKRMSLAELCFEAKRYNVILRAYKFSHRDDVFLEKKPFLAIVKSNSLHMVYVKKIKRFSIVIYDPAEGKIKMKRSSFMKIFHGIILNVIDFSNTPCPCKKKAVVPLIHRIMTCTFQTLAITTLFAGFYFTNSELPFVISVSLFIIAILFQTAAYLFLIASMKKFNQKYMNYCNIDNYCKNKKRLILLQEYKSVYFSAPLETVSALVSLIAFIILLIINSPINVLVTGIILIGYFVYVYFSDQRISKMKQVLSKKEEAFLRGMPIEKNALIMETYRLGSIINRRKILIFIIGLLSSTTLMICSNMFTLNFCLLYFFFYIFFLEAYDKFLHGIFSNESRKRLESRFCDFNT